MEIVLKPLPSTSGEQRYSILADRRPAGGITAYLSSFPVASWGIAVAPEKRRRGVAAAALCRLLSLLRDQGFTSVQVRIRSTNAASLALHRSLGFVPVEARPEEDILLLSRDLQSRETGRHPFRPGEVKPVPCGKSFPRDS